MEIFPFSGGRGVTQVYQKRIYVTYLLVAIKSSCPEINSTCTWTILSCSPSCSALHNVTMCCTIIFVLSVLPAKRIRNMVITFCCGKKLPSCGDFFFIGSKAVQGRNVIF